MKRKIWVLGSSNIDSTYNVDNIPVKGETVQAYSYVSATGGKGANQAVAVAHWGADVSFIGAVGDDDSGRKLLDVLKKNGIDTEHVAVIKGIPSGNAAIYVEKSGANCITVYPGANSHVPCDRTVPFKDGDILVSQLEVNLEAVKSYFMLARQQGVFTILNPSPIMPVPAEIIANSDMIVANESEASEIGGIAAEGISEALRCAEKIAESGPHTVIITLGKMGAVLVEDKKAAHIPGFPVEAVDTQGAGDAFLGTLAAMLSRGAPVLKAAEYANVVAALSVTKSGSTQVSLPSAMEAREHGLPYLGAV